MPDQAEKDFETAEYYRRTGRASSACYFYELVCRRYPGSSYAQRARRMLPDMEAEAEKESKDCLFQVTYTVGDLVVSKKGGRTGEIRLLELITRIAPQTWDSAGGAGRVQYFPLGSAIVVNQTADVHRRIQAVLTFLRASGIPWDQENGRSDDKKPSPEKQQPFLKDARHDQIWRVGNFLIRAGKRMASKETGETCRYAGDVQVFALEDEVSENRKKNDLRLRCETLIVNKDQFVRAEGGEKVVLIQTDQFRAVGAFVHFKGLQVLTLEGTKDNPARLFLLRGNSPPREACGTKIVYNRVTGETRVENATSMLESDIR